MASPSDETLAYARGVVDDFRTAVLEGWFGKHFERRDREPASTPERAEPERDIHGHDHDRGIDR